MSAPSAELRLADGGMILGWEVAERSGFGFTSRSPAVGERVPVFVPKDARVMTVAPTGAGKLLSCTVPAILQASADTQVVVLDLKGENASITARHRAEIGSAVFRVDPWHVTGAAASPLNPLRLLEDSEDIVGDAKAIAETLLPPEYSSRDVFWRSRGTWLVTLAIVHVVRDFPPKRRTLITVHEVLHKWAGLVKRSSDPARLGGGFDVGSQDPDVRHVLDLMDVGSVETVGGIIHFALEAVGLVQGEAIKTSLGAGPSFDLRDFAEGRPMTIYLCVPTALVASQGPLLRLWMWTLMTAVQRRTRAPAGRTLFIVDEAAQLGYFKPLLTAITLLRSYGVDIHTLWQDSHQIAKSFPGDWRTIVNNCSVIQTFGARSDTAWGDTLDHLGIDGCSRAELGNRVLAQVDGRSVVMERMDYRSEPMFEGRFDSNPFHVDDGSPILKPKPKRKRPPRRKRQMVDRPSAEGSPALVTECEAIRNMALSLWLPGDANAH